MFDNCMDLGLKSGAYYQMLCMFGPFHFHLYVADFEALCWVFVFIEWAYYFDFVAPMFTLYDLHMGFIFGFYFFLMYSFTQD